MGKIILKIIGLTLVSVGVILIYDARKITEKTFSFGDQNEATLGLKIVGFLLSISGAVTTLLN